ncbi:MAG: PEP-CTERM sorting domain-containing protein, partial [Pseudomonadota bacterium]
RNSSFDDFRRAPGDSSLTHALYVGKSIGELVVEGSTFSRVEAGHYIKSRAVQTTVRGSTIDDSGGRGSYLIETPEGGQLIVDDNVLIKGANAGNPIAIAHGFERNKGGDFVNPDGFVFVGDNRFTNYKSGNVTFVDNRSDTTAELHENTMTVTTGNLTLVEGDHVVTRDEDQNEAIETGAVGGLPPVDRISLPAVYGQDVARARLDDIPVAVVPAPPALGLLAAGIFGIVAMRRRRREERRPA